MVHLHIESRENPWCGSSVAVDLDLVLVRTDERTDKRTDERTDEQTDESHIEMAPASPSKKLTQIERENPS